MSQQNNIVPNHTHQLLNRHISAPLNNQLQIPNGFNNIAPNNRLNSVSNITLNQNQQSYDDNFQMFAPSKSIWGNSEFSLSPPYNEQPINR